MNLGSATRIPSFGPAHGILASSFRICRALNPIANGCQKSGIASDWSRFQTVESGGGECAQSLVFYRRVVTFLVAIVGDSEISQGVPPRLQFGALRSHNWQTPA